jgi:hypothetical protein
LAFAHFTLREYFRSGRVLVELAALAGVIGIIFWPRGAGGLDSGHFFSLAGLFVLALTLYTTYTLVGLGSRPQGYIVLARRLGRSGYLAGLYLASLAIVLAVYLLLSLLVVLIHRVLNPPVSLSVGGWLLGSVPLCLNMALVAAFVLLLTPLVMNNLARLVILALLVSALSGDPDALGKLPLGTVLQGLLALIRLPLTPLMSGFVLAVGQDYGGVAVEILLAQVILTASLLVLAFGAFDRRELILKA